MQAYSHSKVKLRSSIAVLALVCSAGGAFAEPSVLVPHRAIYDLRVVESPGGTGISSGDGRLVYEFKRDTCGGFTSIYRQVMNVKSGEGSGTTIDFRSTAYESDKDDVFQFENKNIINGNEDTAIQGIAERSDEGITVTLKQSNEEPTVLDQRALFPTQHMKHVLKAAREGKNLFEAPIFDGSGKADSAGDTLTLIGKGVQKAPDGLEQVAQKAGLDKIQHWPITISYFDKSASVTEQTPKFVFKAELYENGITRDLTLNYGSFVVQAKLVGLDMLGDDNQNTCTVTQE